MQSTQHYIDNERNFIANIGQNQPAEVIKFKTAILPVVEQVEIDVDIEKQIAQLQEARINQGIKKVVPVDFDTELGSFFSSISQEKEELKEKVKKEAKTISGLEDLFNELSAAKKKKAIKKKKILLLEPEEKVIEPVELSAWEKRQQELDEELGKVAKEIEEREELSETIEAESIEEKVEDSMIDKVKKQIASLRNANELDKERINQLSSLDSWEKLKEEFLNFKHTVNVQLGTVGGGGLDPHNINSDFLPSTTNTYNLGSTSRRWKDIFLSSNSINLDGATISSDGTGAISIAATGATLPKGSKTEEGNELAVMGTSTSGSLSQPIRKIQFFSAADGLTTANATFEFNAEVADRYSFLDSGTFTLENGSALTDAGITLFQL